MTGSPPGPLGHISHQIVERKIHENLAGGGSIGSQIDDLGDKGAELFQLERDIVEQPAALLVRKAVRPRQQFDVGAQRRQRRPQLMAGVVNKAVLLPPRFLERGKHGVETVGEPPDFVVALDVDMRTEFLCLGDMFDGSGQTPDRPQRPPGHHHAEGGSEPDTTDAHQCEHYREAAEGLVDLVERTGDLYGTEIVGDRDHPQVPPVDLHITDDLGTS